MKPNRVYIGLRLPPDLVDDIDEEREKQRIQSNRTQFIEQAVREFIERLREERQRQPDGAHHVRPL